MRRVRGKEAWAFPQQQQYSTADVTAVDVRWRHAVFRRDVLTIPRDESRSMSAHRGGIPPATPGGHGSSRSDRGRVRPGVRSPMGWTRRSRTTRRNGDAHPAAWVERGGCGFPPSFANCALVSHARIIVCGSDWLPREEEAPRTASGYKPRLGYWLARASVCEFNHGASPNAQSRRNAEVRVGRYLPPRRLLPPPTHNPLSLSFPFLFRSVFLALSVRPPFFYVM